MGLPLVSMGWWWRQSLLIVVASVLVLAHAGSGASLRNVSVIGKGGIGHPFSLSDLVGDLSADQVVRFMTAVNTADRGGDDGAVQAHQDPRVPSTIATQPRTRKRSLLSGRDVHSDFNGRRRMKKKEKDSKKDSKKEYIAPSYDTSIMCLFFGYDSIQQEPAKFSVTPCHTDPGTVPDLIAGPCVFLVQREEKPTLTGEEYVLSLIHI